MKRDAGGQATARPTGVFLFWMNADWRQQAPAVLDDVIETLNQKIHLVTFGLFQRIRAAKVLPLAPRE